MSMHVDKLRHNDSGNHTIYKNDSCFQASTREQDGNLGFYYYMMRTIYSKIDSRKPYQKSQIWCTHPGHSRGHSRPFPAIPSHSRSFSAIPGPFPAIHGHFPAIPGHFRPFPVISWPLPTIPSHFLAIPGQSQSFLVIFRSAVGVPPLPGSISGRQSVFRRVPGHFLVGRVCSTTYQVNFWSAECCPLCPGSISGQ